MYTNISASLGNSCGQKTRKKLKNSDEIKKLMSLGLEKQFNCKVFAMQT